ncbi:hypothetical protein [Paracoccus albus]|uniref:hypothetical protein n=1 Tax=Paracoccus albus TaxID=3017784 RepID=UPI0022EFEDD9|nr:hypothetical protein [Paracoccus albus]WBU61160.1 hypothetical protein PAF20_04395 [Paracoccus albus]
MIRAALILLLIPIAALCAPAKPPELLPLHEVVKIVGERFQGRLLAARVDSPAPYEFALGSDSIQELVLLSKQGNIIIIRLDGETGRILDVRGRGLNAARVPMNKNHKDD